MVAVYSIGTSGTTSNFCIRTQGSALRRRVKTVNLTLILLTWKIRWTPNNVNKWQMGFNLAFKGLRFVSPCIIVQFKQITNQMQQFSSLLSWRLFTAQHVSGVFQPIIRSSMTAVAASGFIYFHKIYCIVNLQLKRDRTYNFANFTVTIQVI
jgi:hypothetical protein